MWNKKMKKELKRILALALAATLVVPGDYVVKADVVPAYEENAEENTENVKSLSDNTLDETEVDELNQSEEDELCVELEESSELTAADKKERNDDYCGQEFDLVYGDKKGKKLRQYLASKYPNLDADHDGEVSTTEMEGNLKADNSVKYSTIEIKGSDFPEISKNMVRFNELSRLKGVDTIIIDGVDEVRNFFLPTTTKHLIIQNTTLNMFNDGILDSTTSFDDFDKKFTDFNLETFVLDNVIIGNRFETVESDVEEVNSSGKHVTWDNIAKKYEFKLSNCQNLQRFIVNVSFLSSQSALSFNMGGTYGFDSLTKENFLVKRNSSIGTIAISSSYPNSFFNQNYETVSEVTFENQYFRSFLIEKMGVDANWDGFITQEELDKVTKLEINPSSVSKRYIDVIHNYNDLQYFRNLETLSIDLENRSGAYIETIKFPETGNLKKISIKNSETRYTNLSIPSIEELVYSQNESISPPTITINDNKGCVKNITMEETNVESVMINNTSQNEGKISLEIYYCTSLKSVEFKGKGYKLNGDASFEECNNLTRIGMDKGNGIWQIDGVFDGNKAAFKVSNCSIIGNISSTSSETSLLDNLNITEAS